MNIILAESEIPEDLKEFFEPVRIEFLSLVTVNTNKYKGAHFAPYPKHLITTCVLATCPKDGVVLDPFCGSAVTGKVALENGRKFVGIEISQESVDLANKELNSVKPPSSADEKIR